MGTSSNKLIAKLIERYIEEKEKQPVLLDEKLSRNKVIEAAALLFLDSKGVLDKLLAEQNYSDVQVKRLKQRLQAV